MFSEFSTIYFFSKKKKKSQSIPYANEASSELVPSTSLHLSDREGNILNIIQSVKLLGCSFLRVRDKSLQLCPTLSNHIDCSPPGSSVHGILQAKILEWVAVHSFRGSSQPRD